MILRYEDLKKEKRKNLVKIFRYLGVTTNQSILDGIIEHSSIEAMRDASVRKQFFRSGSTDMGKEGITAELRDEVVRIAAPALETMGYDIAP
jgi:hypothetical protein